MRQRWLSILIIAASIIVGCVAETGAQGRPYSFFVAGDLGFAVSPAGFTDYYDMGFGGGGGIEYSVSPNWSFIGAVDYKTFSTATEMIKDWWSEEGEWPGATNIDVSGGGISVLTFAIVSKGSLKSAGSTFFPYIKGGFGLTFASVSQIKVEFDLPLAPGQTEWASVEGDQAALSIILGLGLEKKFGAGNSSFFVDAGLHMIVYEDVDPLIAPITAGIKF